MRKFMVSLSDLNIERSQFREWHELLRDPDWRQRAQFLDRLQALLDKIPPVERDVIDLYFFRNKTQETISRILGISQQAVSHRMYAAFRRIIFMLQQPEVAYAQMRTDLEGLLTNPTTINILCDFAKTSSQTATAANLGLPQQRVNWHISAGLRSLQAKMTVNSLFYTLYFGNLMDHKNILRDVARRRNGHHRSASAGRSPAYAGKRQRAASR